MNQWSLKNNWLKFKTSGKLPIILEESVEYISLKVNEEKPKDHKDFWPIMPKTLPGAGGAGDKV